MLALTPRAEAASALATNQLQSLYLRVTNEFADAIFCKPAEPKVPDLTFSLAPMLLQETQATNLPASAHAQFGLLTHSNGVLTVDTTRPTVYVSVGTLQRKSKTYPQLTYTWVYPDFTLQGVRITLDGSGQPCLWEVLSDSSGAELFFASQHLETAAQVEFGKPLPGRHYALERPWTNSPHALVARVLEDGPAVMGPMVYLKASTRDVSTLICRCMPAQVKHLAHTQVYELVPVSGSAEGLLQEAKNLSPKPLAFWPSDAPEGARLERVLRLPNAF